VADRPEKRKRGITRLRVLRTEWLTPHMIRVVLGGENFASFVDNGYTDKYVKLLFLKPDVEYPEPIDLDTIRREFPREQWPTTRTYTVRYHDGAAGELAIDFVTHGDAPTSPTPTTGPARPPSRSPGCCGRTPRRRRWPAPRWTRPCGRWSSRRGGCTRSCTARPVS
jgi:NADPH-dependent ferric siderophore reductase